MGKLFIHFRQQLQKPLSFDRAMQGDIFSRHANS